MKLLSLRSRCVQCGQKHVLSKREANFLANQPKSPLIAYLCPFNHGWHVAREDDERLREGRFDSHRPGDE